jgi:hypothetical protein
VNYLALALKMLPKEKEGVTKWNHYFLS